MKSYGLLIFSRIWSNISCHYFTSSENVLHEALQVYGMVTCAITNIHLKQHQLYLPSCPWPVDVSCSSSTLSWRKNRCPSRKCHLSYRSHHRLTRPCHHRSHPHQTSLGLAERISLSLLPFSKAIKFSTSSATCCCPSMCFILLM